MLVNSTTLVGFKLRNFPNLLPLVFLLIIPIALADVF